MQVAKRVHRIQEYYFSQKMSALKALENSGKDIINLGIGNPDLPPPDSVIKSLNKASEDLSKHGYQPYKGILELRKNMAQFYKNHLNINLNPDSEILPLAGSKEGILHISLAFLNPGDTVLIPNPGYATYSNIAKLVGAEPILYDLTQEANWEPDFKSLEQKDLSKVKIMWINYPHMPTGAPGSLQLFERLVQFAKKKQLLLVHDNPYSLILTQKPLSIFAAVGAKDVALELNSLSKSFNMAGWRIGMVSGSKNHIDALLKVKSNIDSGMFYGLQAGAIQALSSEKKWFTQLNKTYKKRREIIYKIIEKLGGTFEYNAVGFFVWARFPLTKTSEQWSDYLLDRYGFFVTPGSVFGSNGEGYLRFSLCVNEQKLKRILQNI